MPRELAAYHKRKRDVFLQRLFGRYNKEGKYFLAEIHKRWKVGFLTMNQNPMDNVWIETSELVSDEFIQDSIFTGKGNAYPFLLFKTAYTGTRLRKINRARCSDLLSNNLYPAI